MKNTTFENFRLLLLKLNEALLINLTGLLTCHPGLLTKPRCLFWRKIWTEQKKLMLWGECHIYLSWLYKKYNLKQSFHISVTYGISLWINCSQSLLNSLDHIHARARRIIQHLSCSQESGSCLLQCNWLPINYLYKRRILLKMHQVFVGAAPTKFWICFQYHPDQHDFVINLILLG